MRVCCREGGIAGWQTGVQWVQQRRTFKHRHLLSSTHHLHTPFHFIARSALKLTLGGKQVAPAVGQINGGAPCDGWVPVDVCGTSVAVGGPLKRKYDVNAVPGVDR